MTEVHRFEKVVGSGWGLNMFVVALPGGGTLVHSPTWLGEGTFEKIEACGGAPRVLFAPNHFHHLDLARFRARYSKATAVAGEGALPRLAKKGHAGLVAPNAVDALLPEGASWLACAGMRSGEVWLDLGGSGGGTLIAGDAFFNIARPVRGVEGAVLRGLGIAPGLRIGQTTRWLAVADRAVFRQWACATLTRVAPQRVWMSHGEAIGSDDSGEGGSLSDRLTALVRARL